MLTLLSDALIAVLVNTDRLIRWLLRDHQLPAQPCEACAARSRNHPAGQLERYTTTRVAGRPICERHHYSELGELLNGHEIPHR